MKILLSAYACEAGRGSEPGVGWHTAKELAREHEVWVLTRPDDGRPAIEAELERNPNPNLHFVYFTLPVIGGFWQLGTVAFVLHYYLWQVQAYFVARKLLREVQFDVVHHVTFVRYSSPSFLALLPVPFVWGTVGGGERAPAPFWQDFGLRARIYEVLRLTAHRFGELDPFARLTARRSAVTRVTTEDTAIRVRHMGAPRVEIVPEAALPAAEQKRLSACPPPAAGPVRFISMGRLLHWKGFHLGVRAFAAAERTDAEYWILGDGPERATLEAASRELGVGDRVRFFGNLPRAEALECLGQCHVLVHPSLHDSGGWVCLEGMAAGRPILCLDLGGPGVQVTADTGIKVAASTPEQAVSDLAAAMQRLADDAELRQRMGEAGRALVKSEYSWEAKGRQLTALYESLANTPVSSPAAPAESSQVTDAADATC